MAITGIIKTAEGKQFYPVTRASSVICSNGKTVEQMLAGGGLGGGGTLTAYTAEYTLGSGFTVEDPDLSDTPYDGQVILFKPHVTAFDSPTTNEITGKLRINSGSYYPIQAYGITSVANASSGHSSQLTKMSNSFYYECIWSATLSQWVCANFHDVIKSSDIGYSAVKSDNIDWATIGSLAFVDENDVNSDIPSLSDFNVYSTAEKSVGIWIDGKTLYRKTFIFPNVNMNTSTRVTSLSVSVNNAESVFVDGGHSWFTANATGETHFPIPYVNNYTEANLGCFPIVTSTSTVALEIDKTTNFSVVSATITIEYTKTS